MIRKKALLTALIITVFTGCTTTKNYQSCPAYSQLSNELDNANKTNNSLFLYQCDELYNDYNCDLQPRILTTPRASTRYAPVPWYYSNNAYNVYRPYYPNTQSVYYVPIYKSYYPITIGSYIESDEQRPFSSISKKRPSITRIH